MAAGRKDNVCAPESDSNAPGVVGGVVSGKAKTDGKLHQQGVGIANDVPRVHHAEMKNVDMGFHAQGNTRPVKLRQGELGEAMGAVKDST